MHKPSAILNLGRENRFAISLYYKKYTMLVNHNTKDVPRYNIW